MVGKKLDWCIGDMSARGGGVGWGGGVGSLFIYLFILFWWT